MNMQQQRAVQFPLLLDIHHALITALQHETSSLLNLIDHLPSQASLLVNILLTLQGKVVFIGLGKSGLVGRKLAATFSSLGTPSLFLHPSDALHGDLGVIEPRDLIITLSKSATGEEFERIFPLLRQQGNKIILICCHTGPLAQKADLVIQLPLKQEACHLNLAPTSSTTLMMAFGDAIGIVTAQYKKFNTHDFARFHPAGSLGRKLLLTVADLMHTNDAIPLIQPDDTFQNLLLIITQKKLGVGLVVNEQRNLLGIITDGDLRRACNKGITVFNQKAQDIMTLNPKSIIPQMLAQEALEIMELHTISTLTVVNHQEVIGVIHLHDLVKAGL